MAMIFSCVVLDIMLGILVCLVLSSLYYAHVFRYWRKRGVQHLRPRFYFGNFTRVALHRETRAQLLRRVYEASVGRPFVGVYEFSQPRLLVTDPHLLRDILVRDAHVFLDSDFSPPENLSPLLSRSMFVLKGRKWGHVKVKLSRTFTSANMDDMFPHIHQHSNELVVYINNEISIGNAVDVKDMVSRFSTDVIASCVFGVKPNALADPNSEFHLALLEVLEPGVIQKLILTLSLCLPWMLSVLGAVAFPGRVSEFVRMNLWDMVEHRKKSRTVRRDVDQLDADTQLRAEGGSYTHLKYSSNDKQQVELDEDEAVTQAFVFILVSLETCASVVTYTLLELALNPAIQDRLRGEITSVLGKSSSQVTCEAIAKMKYLDMVVAETMRKYPILSSLERKCLSDYEVPGSNVTLEKGTSVLISVLGVHSDPNIYPDPDKFDPERFNNENLRKRSQFVHLPLGEAAKIRSGLQFGQLQAKTALAHILTSFIVRPYRATPRKMRAFHGPLSPDKKIVLAFTELKWDCR